MEHFGCLRRSAVFAGTDVRLTHVQSADTRLAQKREQVTFPPLTILHSLVTTNLFFVFIVESKY